ncbi:MAG: hypothetical protein QN122_02120 [Armatimonadota bacterium]|nr:hypothetical protein [Armatimonadota bacterium]MDR7447892.1 hypothetical protein [Armatimonadota bacterium]MDR7479760.1 hypothetical protein [Armatimonadota bacterium]MDR7487577.1 hypothetical protein [Armatimonadota bacterium]MDR7490238.1 hypothetical protein [Armatimonadota bacterium]
MTTSLLAAAARLSDTDLLVRVQHLAAREREATVALIVHLGELEARSLHLTQGYASLFVYCTQGLRLSEHSAYNRIQAARLARRFPVVLERLVDGALTLATLRLLAPHLTPENHLQLLEAAAYKSKREVAELVARLSPQPPVPTLVRRLPVRAGLPGPPSHPAGTEQTTEATSPLGPAAQRGSPASSAHAPPLVLAASSAPAPPSVLAASPARLGPGAPAAARRAVIAPLGPQHYKIQFTASAETCAKLRQAQALMRHQVPDGDVATIVDRALTALLRELTRRKLGGAQRPRSVAPLPGTTVPAAASQAPGAGPRPGEPSPLATGDPGDVPAPTDAASRSRHIPAAVRRAVWDRDGGRCAFIGQTGQRCTEVAFLEFHHVVPYATGGPATVQNIQLRCRAHNRYEARSVEGPGPAPPRRGPAPPRPETSCPRPKPAAPGQVVAECAPPGGAPSSGDCQGVSSLAGRGRGPPVHAP